MGRSNAINHVKRRLPKVGSLPYVSNPPLHLAGVGNLHHAEVSVCFSPSAWVCRVKAVLWSVWQETILFSKYRNRFRISENTIQAELSSYHIGSRPFCDVSATRFYYTCLHSYASRRILTVRCHLTHYHLICSLPRIKGRLLSCEHEICMSVILISQSLAPEILAEKCWSSLDANVPPPDWI